MSMLKCPQCGEAIEDHLCGRFLRPRIYTRCPACNNDTLTINKNHLLCTWHKCPDPTLIDNAGAKLTEMANMMEAVKDQACKEIGEHYEPYNEAVTELHSIGLVPAPPAEALANAVQVLRDAKGRYNSGLAYENLMVALDAYRGTARTAKKKSNVQGQRAGADREKTSTND